MNRMPPNNKGNSALTWPGLAAYRRPNNTRKEPRTMETRPPADESQYVSAPNGSWTALATPVNIPGANTNNWNPEKNMLDLLRKLATLPPEDHNVINRLKRQPVSVTITLNEVLPLTKNEPIRNENIPVWNLVQLFKILEALDSHTLIVRFEENGKIVTISSNGDRSLLWRVSIKEPNKAPRVPPRPVQKAAMIYYLKEMFPTLSPWLTTWGGKRKTRRHTRKAKQTRRRKMH